MVPDTPSLCTHTHLHLEDRVNLVAAQAVEQLTLDAARAVGAAAGRVGVIQHGLLVRRARLDVLSAGWPEAVEIGPCSWVVRAAHDAHELISPARRLTLAVLSTSTSNGGAHLLARLLILQRQLVLGTPLRLIGLLGRALALVCGAALLVQRRAARLACRLAMLKVGALLQQD